MNEEQRALAWAGLDISKKTFDACIIFDSCDIQQAKKKATRQFKRTLSGVHQFIEWARKNLKTKRIKLSRLHVVMESTGNYSLEAMTMLYESATFFRGSIINPCTTKHFGKSMSFRQKTDPSDARVLAFFGRDRKPTAWEPATPARRALTQISRHRRALVNHRAMTSNQLGEATCDLAKEQLKALMEYQGQLIADAEQALKNLIESDEQLSMDIALLQTIKGVGFIVAVTVLAELGDLRRFSRSRNLSSMVGLNPIHHQSGTSVNAPPRLSKAGNSRVRDILYMAAVSVSRCDHDGPLGQFYLRLVEKGKAKKQALCAVSRKLLVTMRAMLIHGTGYNAPRLPEEGTVA